MNDKKQEQVVISDIMPVPEGERLLSGPSNFAIWFSCNLVTTTMLTGMLFVPGLSFGSTMAAVILGCLLGIVPLMLVGVIGQKTGLVTMVSMRASFGVKGAILPSAINVMILIAWSWAQAALGGLALNYAVKELTGYSNESLFIIITEVIVLVVALYAIKGIALYEKIAMVFIAAVMGAVIFKAFSSTGMANVFDVPADTSLGMTFMVAFDIVVATALSWTPLSADYNRNCKTTKGAILGTGVGYALGTTLSMGSGALMIGMIMAKGIVPSYEPSQVFGEIGFGLIGAVVIFMSIVAANVMCIYSATMSFLNAFPKLPYKGTVIIIGLICTVGALFSGILGSFLNFVYLIGTLFMPIFAIMIADYYVLKQRKYNIDAIVYPENKGEYNYQKGINWVAIIVFAVVAGITYYIARINPIPIGATIPSFIASFVLYLLGMKLFKSKK